MATVYHDEDARLDPLRDKVISVVGYGNQGRAQALNLRDSGVRTVIGVRADATRRQAQSDGFEVLSIARAARQGDIILLLIPDEVMPEVFLSRVLPALQAGKTVCFASGYNVAFGLISPPSQVDVIMVAPRMIGAGVRQRYLDGKGFPSFIGVHQDASGNAMSTALAIAKGIGSTKYGAMATTFAEEAELDLFTEQAFGPAFGQVLLSSIQTLVESGYPVEAAMVELILSGEFAYSLDKISELGFFRQMELHSHTSQYGSMTRSARFISPDLSVKMRDVLEEIRSGAFAREWESEQRAGLPVYRQIKALRNKHPIAEWERSARKAFRID
jgi:ketol-acid reductoisomerase